MLKIFQSLKYIWVALILYLTLSQGGGSGWFEFLKYPGVDKVGHFGLFFVWSLFYFPELVVPEILLINEKPVRFWIVATNSLVLGILIEVAQSFMPYRSSEWLDLLADVLGSVTALLAVNFVRRKKSNLN